MSAVYALTMTIELLVTMAQHILRMWMQENLKIWRVTVNILNKKLQTADKGWSSNLGGWASGKQLINSLL
jgi:hypothetical protein